MDSNTLQVVCAVIFYEGRVLCCKRKAGARASVASKWEFPGGKIEVGESPEEALRREIAEELNLEIQVEAFLMTVQHRYAELDLELHAYRATCASIDALEVREHEEVRWLKPEALKSLDWAEADVPISQNTPTFRGQNTDI